MENAGGESTPSEKVDITYAVNQPSEDYVPGMRQVLYPLAKCLNIDVFSLAETIANQENVGNVICLTEDLDNDSEDDNNDQEESGVKLKPTGAVVLGVFTILNLVQYFDLLKPVCDALVKSKNESLCSLLVDRNTMKKMGVLFAERISSSLPPSACEPVYRECVADVKWTLDLDPDQLNPEERDELQYYDYEHIIVLAWAHHCPTDMRPSSAKRKRAVAHKDDFIVDSLTFANEDLLKFFRSPNRTDAIAINANKTVKANDGSLLHCYLVVFIVPYAELCEAEDA